MMQDLPKQYDPRAAQQRWLAFWDERRYWHSRPDPSRRPYTIVIPPPNVTGALHMGHALNNTLQDILIRWRRMQGYNTEWMPGTDHAGIATQAVVLRRIREEEGKTARDIGREEFLRRTWAWKDRYEARILDQLKQLGCSCDWQRTRFTMDEGYCRAVRVTFFNWFRDGYIFRGKRLVNWDAQLQTSVADDETYTEEIQGGFWTFRYPVQGSNEFIRFSTTRPETMLGDTAVAVHPRDERYRHLIGRTVTIPLVGRDIPIIADGQLADPEKGTGAVKVTPAHDPNDHACGQRHKLPMINILNPDGTINANGGRFAGLERYQAREEVTREMERLGLFEGREDRAIPLKFSDRSKTPIEPYLSDQWFVRMGDREDGQRGFAQLAMDAVTSGRVQFFPERYARSYLDWLGEKRDWCISRQLWWGHRIPVWSAPCMSQQVVDDTVQCLKDLPATGDGKLAYQVQLIDEQQDPTVFGAVPYAWLHVCLLEDDPKVIAFLRNEKFVEEEDVLDTWFSSQLWPHATFGWPERTAELAYYYPTSTLVTSRDIITLWVARMVISGLYNMGDVPFREGYITPKLLDAFGETMSKSKGNGVDPLDIIDRYGTDALRFQMAFVAGDMQDCRLPAANVCPHCDALVPVKHEHMYMRTRKVSCPSCKRPFRPGGPWPADDPELPTAKQASDRFEVGRNFANKLWNAARFLLLNLEGYAPEAIRTGELPVEDRWILSRLTATALDVTAALEGYHFSEAARLIYDFTWSEFCDWYVEMSKGRLKDQAARPAVQRVLVGVLDGVLRLAHPILPFVTESIWQALNEAAFERGLPAPDPAADSVMIAPWPELPAEWRDAAVERRMAQMQQLVGAVREVRNRYQIDARQALDVFVRCGGDVAGDFQALAPFITQLAGVGRLEAGPDVVKPPQAAGHVKPDFAAYISFQGLIDVAGEIKRLEKQLAEKRKHLAAAEAKLGNASFVAKAPADVVQQQRHLVADLRAQIQALEANMAELRQQ
jgi:valyl-tRNA synthetase